MKTPIETPVETLKSGHKPVVKIFGVGSAGVGMMDAFSREEFAGAEFIAINTTASSLSASSATLKIHLETRLLRGLGTGGDPERGRALAEEQFSSLKNACIGANVVFIVAGLGGGAGSGISPVLARAAKETGALVLAFVTLPFPCEGNRRQKQAHEGLDKLKAAADGVICLPGQKTAKLIDENTSVIETFRITGALLAEGLRGIWRLLTRPGLIEIHFDDLCALVRDRHSESVFAFVEANGTARAHEAMEKLLAHPLLDKGRAFAEADAVMVSLTGGKDLKMAEVNRVMENINRHCDHAQIIMGAAVNKELKSHLSITVIVTKNSTPKVEPVETAVAAAEQAAPHGATARAAHSFPNAPSLSLEQREQLVARHAGRTRKTGAKMQQAQLPLAIVSKGRFDKSEPTLYKGEDLDIPTYVRRGVPLN